MSVKIEFRRVPASRSVSYDIARDIADNHLHSNIVVVSAGNPIYAHAAVKKQWMQAIRLVERERASTINIEKLRVLMPKLAHMKRQRFTTLTEYVDHTNTVCFTTIEDLATQPLSCRVLYITHPVSDELLQTMIAHMPDNSLVVRYLRPELDSEFKAAASHPWRNTM